MILMGQKTGFSGRKKISIAVFLILSLCLIFSTALADIEATVVWVFDGDTVKLSDGTKLRYAGINCPELAHDGQPEEPFAHESSVLNRHLTLNKRVRIQLDEERYDQYSRLLAYVFLPDGTFVNAALVEKGLATVCATPPTIKYYQHLLALQRHAIHEKVGIWSSANRVEEGYYIGNTRSHRFHRPSCYLGHKTTRRNKVIHRNRLEAFYEGLSPCKKCNP